MRRSKLHNVRPPTKQELKDSKEYWKRENKILKEKNRLSKESK